MPRGNQDAGKKNGNGANLGFEEKLWLAADKLRGQVDAAEYKHIVLGLIFLKYISDAFEERHETLRDIARELVRLMRENVTVDWTVRETARAHLRVLVKRLLRKYGYPPDKQDKATHLVLEQAEVICRDWVAA